MASRLAVTLWAAFGAAIGVWGFVGGQAFHSGPAFWAMVAVFAGLPLVSGISQLLIERPSPVERYILTDRFFVVQSNRGCHAYSLANLGDLTVDLAGGHGRLILRRHPNVSRELGWVMRFTAWANQQETDFRVILADRLDDAPELLRRIRTAQAALAQEPPPPADGVCPVGTDIPQSMPYEWGSLLGAVAIGFMTLVTTGAILVSGDLSASLPVLALLAVVGWYAWSGLRARERGLLRAGRWVMGEITEVQQADPPSDTWRVRYRYPLQDESSVRAELARSTFAEIERWAVGDLIEVRYDPIHPERHLVRSTA